MPYVPTKDRPVIDKEVEKVVRSIVKNIKEPIDVFDKFYKDLRIVCSVIRASEEGYGVGMPTPAHTLGYIIQLVARKYNYDGAWLGELNYATTRLIQEIPRALIKKFRLPESNELRYWIYAEFVGYLGALSHHFQMIKNVNWIDQGFAGVFTDVKDEYKRRINISYEAAQIIKSGDCMDAPYYTRLVKVENYKGEVIGHVEVMFARSDKTLKKDIVGTMFLREGK